MLSGEQPQINLYTPVRLLGESTTAYTYLYRHEQRKRYAVFKIMQQPLRTSAEKEEFLTYAKLLRKLVHRNILPVQEFGLYPSGEAEEQYGYLVMQYFEGHTMRERFSAEELPRPDEIMRLLLDLTGALQYASSLHVTHGNLHPGNILWNEREVYLTDFSLPSYGSEAPGAAVLYRAPEHLMGEPGAASDQYALAVMAYEWLCGRRPYTATSPAALLFQQEREPLTPPASLNPQLNPLAEKVLLQALARDVRERFPQIQDFGHNYRRALMGQSFQPSYSHISAPAPVNGALSLVREASAGALAVEVAGSEPSGGERSGKPAVEESPQAGGGPERMGQPKGQRQALPLRRDARRRASSPRSSRAYQRWRSSLQPRQPPDLTRQR